MTTETTTGALIVNRDGYTTGPRYGQIYTAPAGRRGFVAGCRSHATPGLGLLYAKRFDTRAAAEQYLIDLDAY